MIDFYNYLQQLDFYRKELQLLNPFDDRKEIDSFLINNLEKFNEKYIKYISNEYNKQKTSKNIFEL
jgi:hypothetical protein